jgi:hypothetical protein
VELVRHDEEVDHDEERRSQHKPIAHRYLRWLGGFMTCRRPARRKSATCVLCYGAWFYEALGGSSKRRDNRRVPYRGTASGSLDIEIGTVVDEPRITAATLVADRLPARRKCAGLAPHRATRVSGVDDETCSRRYRSRPARLRRLCLVHGMRRLQRVQKSRVQGELRMTFAARTERSGLSFARGLHPGYVCYVYGSGKPGSVQPSCCT